MKMSHFLACSNILVLSLDAKQIMKGYHCKLIITFFTEYLKSNITCSLFHILISCQILVYRATSSVPRITAQQPLVVTLDPTFTVL